MKKYEINLPMYVMQGKKQYKIINQLLKEGGKSKIKNLPSSSLLIINDILVERISNLILKRVI